MVVVVFGPSLMQVYSISNLGLLPEFPARALTIIPLTFAEASRCHISEGSTRRTSTGRVGEEELSMVKGGEKC